MTESEPSRFVLMATQSSNNTIIWTRPPSIRLAILLRQGCFVSCSRLKASKKALMARICTEVASRATTSEVYEEGFLSKGVHRNQAHEHPTEQHDDAIPIRFWIELEEEKPKHPKVPSRRRAVGHRTTITQCSDGCQGEIGNEDEQAREAADHHKRCVITTFKAKNSWIADH
mmetsp:Transcript_70739/g.229835  ORF Transcript_70739/g.229835 Transcript_70739/m.229835 type:complete len:172 (-) Transcript_70739:650-1165(-)